jgi:hypothetical protein
MNIGVGKVVGIIVAIIGLIASCIGIYTFITGNSSLSSTTSQSQIGTISRISAGTTSVVHNNGNTSSSGSQTTAQGLKVAPTSFIVTRDPNTSGCSYFPNHGWECIVNLYNTTSDQLNWMGKVPDGSAIAIRASSSGFIFANGSTSVDVSIPDMPCPASADITFAVNGGDAAHVQWKCSG